MVLSVGILGQTGKIVPFLVVVQIRQAASPMRGGIIEYNMLWFRKCEYRGHGLEFWKQIQDLHDLSIHWEGNKLTKIGQDHVKKLKERFC